jgi:hypothetical protein
MRPAVANTMAAITSNPVQLGLFRLFDLPPELRIIVYEFAFAGFAFRAKKALFTTMIGPIIGARLSYLI